MPSETQRHATQAKVQAHRQRLREQGLRPLQIWVPDVRSKAFAAAARRQSLAVATGKAARQDQKFIDAVAVTFDE